MRAPANDYEYLSADGYEAAFKGLLSEIAKDPEATDIRLQHSKEKSSLVIHVHTGPTIKTMPVPSAFDGEWMNLSKLLLPNRPEKVEKNEFDADWHQEIEDEDGAPAFIRGRASLSANTRGELIVLRILPNTIPTPEQLQIPPSFVDFFCALDDGLVIIGGKTGSGKTTTIASLLVARALRRKQICVSIEDPSEYLFPYQVGDHGSIFESRQVNLHTATFESGIRVGMRQAPDVLNIGEIRDADTAAAAVIASFSGQLVIGSTHTRYAWQGVQRIAAYLDIKGSGMSGEVGRELLATNCRASVAQRIIRLTAEQSRGLPKEARNAQDRAVVPLHEIMTMNEGAANIVRAGDWIKLKNVIETGRSDGMQTFKRAVEIRQSERKLPDKFTIET